jgi:hypothetical protein
VERNPTLNYLSSGGWLRFELPALGTSFKSAAWFVIRDGGEPTSIALFTPVLTLIYEAHELELYSVSFRGQLRSSGGGDALRSGNRPIASN